MERLYAVFSKWENVTRVHYSHLSEQQAEGEAERMNDHCRDAGVPCIYWAEGHHPDAVYVID